MSRQTDIADAAIATLARDGMRGLTHRAVDRAAGLPEGSVSYYFRTRQALLRATVERLADLDAAEVPALPQHDLEAFADATADLLQGWLTTGRQRQLARYELALEATRRPELRTVLVAAGAGLRAMIAGRFAAAGVTDITSPHRLYMCRVNYRCRGWGRTSAQECRDHPCLAHKSLAECALGWYCC